MRADQDDAPAYLHRRKRSRLLRMLMLLGMGFVIAWTTLTLLGKILVIDVTGLARAFEMGRQSIHLKPAQEAAHPHNRQATQTR